MNDLVPDPPHRDDGQGALSARKRLSGTYVGENNNSRLELRLDLAEEGVSLPYQPLNLLSGDFFHDVGGGEWEHRHSFIVEHPHVAWKPEQLVIVGRMVLFVDLETEPSHRDWLTRQILKVTIPRQETADAHPQASIEIIRWGIYRTKFIGDYVSPFFRTIDLEIDRIANTALPAPFLTDSVTERPADLLSLEMDVSRAYQQAGIDLRVISDQQVFGTSRTESTLTWHEDELHRAMESHFSEWRNEPQWKLYLLIATHFKLYPEYLVTGIMYDSQYRDPLDAFPRQGAAVFYESMRSPECWGHVTESEFTRNYLRTCVHELGHALNLIHSFDKERPDSLSWMNYPWRYPYGYDLPPGWDGTSQYWQNCRFEFDLEELRHLRHHPLLEVIPGGSPFGVQGHDTPIPRPTSLQEQSQSPLALYLRTRPPQAIFQYAEPVVVEVKLRNQMRAPVVVPGMLNPEFGLLTVYVRDVQGRVRSFRPLFRVCGQATNRELPAGESLYESIFLGYGADGFYFEQPGKYQIWAVYGAGGVRLRSNTLLIRVAHPQQAKDEEMALRAFGHEQGHVLYMRGAEHLRDGTDELREVTERFPQTHLARYVHFCFGKSRARAFKDVVTGRTRPADPSGAVAELVRASEYLAETDRSALDNITHKQAADQLYESYRQMGQTDKAESVIKETIRYFERMNVKPEVILDLQQRVGAG